MAKRYLTKPELIKRYLLILLIATVGVFVVLHFYLLRGNILLELLLGLNIGSFAMFGFDKSMASYENMPRLPERFFHIVELMGGSVGILIGMYTFRHKTRKLSFAWKTYAIVLFQIGLIAAYYYWIM